MKMTKEPCVENEIKLLVPAFVPVCQESKRYGLIERGQEHDCLQMFNALSVLSLCD